MISLEQTLDDQKDIESLCSPKLSTNFEKYGPNNNYGFTSILKQYSNYPKDKPINAVIPHGIYLYERNIFPGEINVPVSGVLNYPAFRQKAWKKAAKNKKIIASASPFIYATKLFKSEYPTQERKGTLYFPPHSTAMMKSSYTNETVIKQLQTLPEQYQPITICMHWYDISQGLHKDFIKSGFNVVSAGHLHDDNFIFRWLHLISQFKSTMSSNLGSSIFYSVVAGVPHQLMPTSMSYSVDTEFSFMSKKEGKSNIDRKGKIRALFLPEHNNIISVEQLEIVNYCLGNSFLKSPKNLLKTLNSLT